MRETLLDCTTLNWSRISPAIFGALFQSIMDKKARRNLGAHYTSEVNILKALRPLFLDALREEFERIKRDKKRLLAFHKKLGHLKVLDPACGCGNFLVIAYRGLRLLELDVLREMFKASSSAMLDVSQVLFVDVDQFYGIEIEEYAMEGTPTLILIDRAGRIRHQLSCSASDMAVGAAIGGLVAEPPTAVPRSGPRRRTGLRP